MDNNENVYFTYSDGAPEAVLLLNASGVVSDFAGNDAGYSGDGGPATAAQVYPGTGEPVSGGMVTDSSGNFYIADASNNRVRKVNAAGIITTVAGTGAAGFSGDGGPAILAELYTPTAVALDSAGNLYIADGNNERIRKVDLNGIITTVAGDGYGKFGGYSGDGGPATSAQLAYPSGIAVDSAGRLFIGDKSNNRIRVVDPAGFITTIAGGATSGFSGDGGPATSAELYAPTAVVLGSGNSVYFADTGNHRIRQLTIGCSYTVSGLINIGQNGSNIGDPFTSNGGAAAVPVTATPSNCSWTAVSDVPWITITSGHSGTGNGTVNFSVDPNPGPARTGTVRIGGITFTVLEDGSPCSFGLTSLSAKYGAAAASGTVTVNAPAGCTWSVNNNAGFITITAGGSGNGNGSISYNVTANTAALSRIGTLFINNAAGIHATAFTITQAGQTSAFNYIISTVAGNGNSAFSGDYGQATLAGLIPQGIARDSSGNLFITDRSTGASGARVRKMTPSGIISTVAGGGAADPFAVGGLAVNVGLYDPIGVALDSVGNVYFTDANGGAAVFKVDASGLVSIVAGGIASGYSGDGGPATAAELSSPAGLFIDGAGNLFIADSGNNRVRKVNASGIITTAAGNGGYGFSGDGGQATLAELFSPQAVALDNAGNLYIADARNNRIRKVDLSGTITTVAGNGGFGYSGDGGLATAAQLYFPSGVAVDGDGRLFISDQSNNVIRLVDTSGVISTIAGEHTSGFSGDGGPATSAHLYAPSSLVLGLGDTVYFVDGGNYRVRQLSVINPISQSAVALGFFPVTPCRAVDTRASQGKTGAYGPPALAPYTGRNFPLEGSACNLPSTTQAYSLNFTVVPPGPLDFLSAWPSNKAFPGVSTLNSPDGSVIANAAIVPDDPNGNVEVTAGESTDLIIDTNGYFAPPNGSELAFYPMTPCRVVDTRDSNKAAGFGPPSLSTSGRVFAMYSSACNIPNTARAYALNLTVVPKGSLSFLSIWPADKAFPNVSTLNSNDGSILANAAIVPAAANGNVEVTAGNPTDFIMDINGYFAAPGSPGALHFYPVVPCRVADTRASQGFGGSFGPPSLTAYQGRVFPMQQSACGIPSAAKAYSLNITVVPQGALSFLSAWPSDKPFPNVSTLNSPKGLAIANAAIVPAAADGSIEVTAGNPTDVIIDINGYFAP